jgi:hypothetical protein
VLRLCRVALLLIGAGAQVNEPLLHPFDFGDCAVVPAGADADRLGRVTLLGLRGGKVDVLVLGIRDG